MDGLAGGREIIIAGNSAAPWASPRVRLGSIEASLSVELERRFTRDKREEAGNNLKYRIPKYTGTIKDGSSIHQSNATSHAHAFCCYST
jgi:hypothetical protein